MGTTASQRVSPNRVVLILALLLGVWLAFQFFPRKKPAPPMPTVSAESRLRAVGLSDNVDWEGLPEFFAVWADRLEWSENKTWFAYWNPGANSYSYLFEAVRHGTEIHFRQISLANLPAGQNQHFSAAESVEDVGEVLERELRVDTHPFVFLSRGLLEARIHFASPFRTRPPLPPPPSQVAVDLPPNSLEAPKPANPDPKTDDDGK